MKRVSEALPLALEGERAEKKRKLGVGKVRAGAYEWIPLLGLFRVGLRPMTFESR